MKKALALCLVLVSAVTMLAGCGSDSKTNNTSSTNSNVSSSVSTQSTSSTSESSTESSTESSQSLYPPIELKMHTSDDMRTIVRKTDIGEFSGFSYTKGTASDYNDNILTASANYKFSGTYDDLKKYLKYLKQFEKEHVYVSVVRIKPDNEIFAFSVDTEAPYIRDGVSVSNDDIGKVIDKYSVDKIKLTDSFLDFHDNYSYNSAVIIYLLNDDDMVRVNMEKDFNNYNGFVSYKEAILNAGNFTFDEAMSMDKIPVDGDTITKARYTLLTDKFNKS